MFNREWNVKVCDATAGAIKTIVWLIKIKMSNEIIHCSFYLQNVVAISPLAMEI